MHTTNFGGCLAFENTQNSLQPSGPCCTDAANILDRRQQFIKAACNSQHLAQKMTMPVNEVQIPATTPRVMPGLELTIIKAAHNRQSTAQFSNQ